MWLVHPCGFSRATTHHSSHVIPHSPTPIDTHTHNQEPTTAQRKQSAARKSGDRTRFHSYLAYSYFLPICFAVLLIDIGIQRNASVTFNTT
ncbi:hypothetical protein L211DRAFT_841992 [Terfezia boudieri ATCC MYA-4762]|uniref:Uncharacterized protein n=1 Tax=Terfezia boudieri ATCC MYA-4762 TaxID=1051890 RepID=A0A3N4LBA0_9PEZI|nr:hypothetical protein L211DRAFT_841992 [Terfezia boudieri ATCC MYA-4762]